MIYAATFVIYAALEGQILASSIEQLWNLPIGVWYLVVGLIFIPLTWYGMTQLSWTMWVTFPVYLVLIVVAFVKALHHSGGFPAHIFTAAPPHSVLGALGVLGVLAGLAGTIGLNPLEFSDYARFIAPGRFRRTAWTSVVLPYVLMFFVAFPLGVFFTLTTGQTNPGIYFNGLLGLGFGVLFAWITQVRINLTNVYSGSMALTNFLTRTTGRKTSRIVAVAVVAIASVALMFANVLGHVLSFLDWDGIFLMSWVGTVVADLLIVKKWLKIGPRRLEYARSRLRMVNPVGPVALVIAVGIGSLLHYGVGNPYLVDLSAFIAFGISTVTHTALAVLTRGRFYLRPGLGEDGQGESAATDPSAQTA
jgi:purine-cytosine permease-like protein